MAVSRSDSLQALLDATSSTTGATSEQRRIATHHLQEELDEIRTITRRTKTSTVPQVVSGPHLGAAYANTRWRTVLEVLERKQLRTHYMVQTHFQYLLPKTSDTKRQRGIHYALENAPMTVSVADLNEVLSLTLSTEQSPPTQAGHHYLYIRSGHSRRRSFAP